MPDLFISYSHVDEDLKKELEKHLQSLVRLGQIDVWHDRRIPPGAELENEIDFNIRKASIILLLVSSDFIASDYCYNIELKTAIERHESGEAVVLPVILRPCSWTDQPFGKFKAATRDGKEIVKFETYDDGFLEVVESIKNLLPRAEKKKDLLKDSKIETDIRESHVERSSNLRIKRRFTDEEKDSFLSESYQYIRSFFEASLKELESRNNGVSIRYEESDSRTFTGIIYVSGEEKESCTIHLPDNNSAFSGITYTHGKAARGINESLSIEDDGYLMQLKPTMNFGTGVRRVEGFLTQQGAAEFYWEMLISRLQ